MQLLTGGLHCFIREEVSLPHFENKGSFENFDFQLGGLWQHCGLLAPDHYPFPSTTLGFYCVHCHAKDKVMSLKGRDKSSPYNFSLAISYMLLLWLESDGSLELWVGVLMTTEKRERNSLYFLHYKDVIPVS